MFAVKIQVASSDRDHRNAHGLPRPSQPAQDEKTVPAKATSIRYIWRKIQIQQDQVGLDPPNGRQGCRAVFRRHHIISKGPQLHQHRLLEHNVVVDDEDDFSPRLVLGPGWLTFNPVAWASARYYFCTGFHYSAVLSSSKIK